jgi:methyl-accepting chemotaxis protein
MEDSSQVKIKPVFLSLLFLSVALILALAVFNTEALISIDTFWIIPVVCCLPLFLYCFFLWNKLSKQIALSQDAIDSVYYFGFLITIEILAICIFKVTQISDGLDIKAVALQFGAGLLATGIALFGRMVLLAAAGKLDILEPNDNMDEFSVSVMRASDAVKQATAEARVAVKDMKERLGETIDSFIEETSDTLGVLQEDMKDLGKASKSATELLEELRPPLEVLADGAGAAGDRIKETGTSSKELTAALATVAETLSKLENIDQTIEKVRETLDIIGSQPETLDKFIESLNETIYEMGALKDTILSMKVQAQDLPGQLEGLNAASEKAAKGLSEVDDWTGKLSESMETAIENLDQLGQLKSELQEVESSIASIMIQASASEQLMANIKKDLSMFLSANDMRKLESSLSGLRDQAAAAEPIMAQLKDTLTKYSTNKDLREVEKTVSSVLRQAAMAEPLLRQITEKLTHLASTRDLKEVHSLVSGIIEQTQEASTVFRKIPKKSRLGNILRM